MLEAMADHEFGDKFDKASTIVTERRPSDMSIEDPISPTSSSSDTDDSESIEATHPDNKNPAHLSLSRQLSQTSSVSAVGGVNPNALRLTMSRRSAATTGTLDPDFEVDFAPDDKGNPQNWSSGYKLFIIAMMSYSTTAVVLYSTSYTSGIPGMMDDWGISDNTGILGMTTYLFGMATGAVVLAPLSEMYGRRPIYLVTLVLFLLFVTACAVAQNIATILTIRFFGAFCASALISNAPGSVNDIVDEDHRALAFSVWSIGPMNGPVIGPIVGGLVYQYMGWRWTNWIVVILAGVALAAQLACPETYSPQILRARASKRRKETGDTRYWCRYDEKQEFLPALKVNLSRPFVLTVTEPICIFWDLYVALVYGTLYLCFVAYPIVFSELRGWSPALTGLSFAGIGVGSLITIALEPVIRKVINMHKIDPETGKPYPEAMVSVVCVSAILIPLGEIWFAWTCTPDMHWILPILGGIPFGMGNAGVFIYATNYLVQSYNIYAASALAGNAVLRSVLGATLPLAGPALYSALGAHWAGTLLGLLEAACIPIPFIFYRYGAKIREKSTLIRAMQEDKRKADARHERLEKRALQRAEAEAQAGAAMSTAAAVTEVVETVEDEKDLEKGR